jgi:hypothetical protein
MMSRMTTESGLMPAIAGAAAIVALVVLLGLGFIAAGGADAARESSSSEIMRMMERAKGLPAQAFDAI